LRLSREVPVRPNVTLRPPGICHSERMRCSSLYSTCGLLWKLLGPLFIDPDGRGVSALSDADVRNVCHHYSAAVTRANVTADRSMGMDRESGAGREGAYGDGCSMEVEVFCHFKVY
jgi:hypothetical protein